MGHHNWGKTRPEYCLAKAFSFSFDSYAVFQKSVLFIPRLTVPPLLLLLLLMLLVADAPRE